MLIRSQVSGDLFLHEKLLLPSDKLTKMFSVQVVTSIIACKRTATRRLSLSRSRAFLRHIIKIQWKQLNYHITAHHPAPLCLRSPANKSPLANSDFIRNVGAVRKMKSFSFICTKLSNGQNEVYTVDWLGWNTTCRRIYRPLKCAKSKQTHKLSCFSYLFSPFPLILFTESD